MKVGSAGTNLDFSFRSVLDLVVGLSVLGVSNDVDFSWSTSDGTATPWQTLYTH